MGVLAALVMGVHCLARRSPLVVTGRGMGELNRPAQTIVFK